MRRQQTAPGAFKSAAMALTGRPFGMTTASRLLGLNVGDWSTILLGLVLSGLLLAFI
jgi:hypothetical protein